MKLNWLRKLGRSIVVVAVALAGVVAGLYILGCRDRGEGEKNPPPKVTPPATQPADQEPAQTPPAEPPPATTTRVDSEEVEQGQPIPHNYLE